MCTIGAVSHIERIKTAFGVDFEDSGVGIEHFSRHFATVDEARVGERLLVVEIAIEEAIASERVGQVHIHHAPRDSSVCVSVERSPSEEER